MQVDPDGYEARSLGLTLQRRIAEARATLLARGLHPREIDRRFGDGSYTTRDILAIAGQGRVVLPMLNWPNDGDDEAEEKPAETFDRPKI